MSKASELNEEELNTVLAALRVFQWLGYGDTSKIPAKFDVYAREGCLNDDQIDVLACRLNGSADATTVGRYEVLLRNGERLVVEEGEDSLSIGSSE